MNIVITGGVGFVGTNLAKRLLEDGHKVIVLDDYSVGTVENQIEGIKYIPMNIEQINYMSGDEVDVCFHLAALSSRLSGQPTGQLSGRCRCRRSRRCRSSRPWCQKERGQAEQAAGGEQHRAEIEAGGVHGGTT